MNKQMKDKIELTASKNGSVQLSRRDFLKATAFVGLGAALSLNKAHADQAESSSGNDGRIGQPILTRQRTLGSGENSMEMGIIHFFHAVKRFNRTGGVIA